MKFLVYAIRSATELQSHLYAGLDQEYISAEQFDALYKRAVDAKNLLHGFRRYLRNHKA